MPMWQHVSVRMHLLYFIGGTSPRRDSKRTVSTICLPLEEMLHPDFCFMCPECPLSIPKNVFYIENLAFFFGGGGKII